MNFPRFAIPGLLTAALVSVSNSSEAQMPDREKARLIMFDACVLGAARRGNEMTDFAESCRCASKSTAKKLSDDQVAAVVGADRLRGSAVRVWNAEMKACKAS